MFHRGRYWQPRVVVTDGRGRICYKIWFQVEALYNPYTMDEIGDRTDCWGRRRVTLVTFRDPDDQEKLTPRRWMKTFYRRRRWPHGNGDGSLWYDHYQVFVVDAGRLEAMT